MAGNFVSSKDTLKGVLSGLRNEEMNQLVETTNTISKIDSDLRESQNNESDTGEVIVRTLVANNSESRNIISLLSTINNNIKNTDLGMKSLISSVSSVNALLSSSLTSIVQMNAVLSAFRADYIMINNGQDIRGYSYINKGALTSGLSVFNRPTLRQSLSELQKVGKFADLMSNPVRSKIGNKDLAKDDDEEGLLTKLFGKIGGDSGKEIAGMLTPLLQMAGIDDSNLASLAGSGINKFGDKGLNKQFEALNKTINELAQGGGNSGVLSQIAALLQDKTGLGADVQDEQKKERNPKKVFSALAPFADDIKDMVEAEYKAFSKRPKSIPIYTTPVWIVNSSEQKSYIDKKEEENTRETELLINKFMDIVTGDNTNQLNKNQLDIDIDKYGILTITGEFTKQLLSSVGLGDADTNTQQAYLTQLYSEARSRKKQADTLDNIEVNEETGKLENNRVNNPGKLLDVSTTNIDQLRNAPLRAVGEIISGRHEEGGMKRVIHKKLKGVSDDARNVVRAVFHKNDGESLPSHHSGKSTKINAETSHDAVLAKGELQVSKSGQDLINALLDLKSSVGQLLATRIGLSGASKSLAEIYNSEDKENVKLTGIEASIPDSIAKDPKLKALFKKMRGIPSDIKSLFKKKGKKQRVFGQDDKNFRKEEPKEEESDEEPNKKPEDENPDDKSKDEDKEKEKEAEDKAREEEAEKEKEEAQAKSDAEVDEAKEKIDADKDQKITDAQSAADNEVKEKQTEIETEKQNQIQEMEDQKQKDLENQQQANQQEMEENRQAHEEGVQTRQKAQDDLAEYEANQIKSTSDKKQNILKDEAKDEKEQGKKAIDKLKDLKNKVVDKIKNSKIANVIKQQGKKLAAAAKRFAKSFKKLIKRVGRKIKNVGKRVAKKLGGIIKNLAKKFAMGMGRLIANISAKAVSLVAAISEKIPFVGPGAALAIIAGGLVGVGALVAKIISKAKKGKQTKDDGKATKDAEKESEKQKKKSKKKEKDKKKKKKKNKEEEDEKEESAENEDSKGEDTSSIKETMTKVNTKRKKGDTDSSNDNDKDKDDKDSGKSSLMGMGGDMMSLLLKTMDKSDFVDKMLKDPEKGANFLFSMTGGTNIIGLKDASLNVVNNLQTASNIATTSSASLLSALASSSSNSNTNKSSSNVSTTNLLDGSYSEDATLAYSQYKASQASKDTMNEYLKSLGYEVIEDDEGHAMSTAEIVSEEAKAKAVVETGSSSTSSGSSSSSSSSDSSDDSSSGSNSSSSSSVHSTLSNGTKATYNNYTLKTSAQEEVDSYNKKFSALTSSNSSTKVTSVTNSMLKSIGIDTSKLTNAISSFLYGLEANGYDVSQVSFDSDGTTGTAKSGKGKFGRSLLGLGSTDPNAAGNFLDASSYALNNGYKETDGGTYPAFFNSYLSKSGVNVKSEGSIGQIKEKLQNGNPVILMGEDDTNSGNTPYGDEPHYVVATGLDDNGNVTIEDSESPTGGDVYNLDNTLRHSSIKLSTSSSDSSGKGSTRSSSRKSKSGTSKRFGGRKSRSGKSIRFGGRRNHSVRYGGRKGRGRKGRGHFGLGKHRYGKGYDKWLFVGDSRTVGLQSATGCESIAKVGQGYSYFVQEIPSIEQHTGYNIVLWFGVNDCGSDSAAKSAAEKYAAKYNEIASTMSGVSDILVCTVGPCADKYGDDSVHGGAGQSVADTNTYISTFNNTLISNLDSTIQVIDLYTFLQNKIDAGEDITQDCLHYNSDVYQEIYDYVLGGNYSSVSGSSDASTDSGSLGTLELDLDTYVDASVLSKYVKNADAELVDSEDEEETSSNSSSGSSSLLSSMSSDELAAYAESAAGNTGKGKYGRGKYGKAASITRTSSIGVKTSSTTTNSSSNTSSSSSSTTSSVKNSSTVNLINRSTTSDTYTENGVTYINNNATPNDEIDSIIKYFSELNNIQDDSLEVLLTIYEKLRKQKGATKKNFDTSTNTMNSTYQRSKSTV